MTPNLPSSSDGSGLPPRHRPTLGNLIKDTTEQDLWAFDDLDPAAEEAAGAPPKPAGPGIPAPRDVEKMKVRQLVDNPGSKPVSYQESVNVNVGKSRPVGPAGPSKGQSKPGQEFDELDHWDEPEAARPLPEIPVEKFAPSPVEPPPPATAKTQPVVTPPPVTPPADSQDEFSPVVPANATPVSLRPHLHLSKVERLGLVALTALLLIGGVMIYLNTINRLPTATGRVKATDFPIQGQHLAIVSADSFWRAPKAADTVRRGTQLVPVAELTSSGGPGAIRVFFRNDDGDLIGDAVTRHLQSGTKLQIAATAGFDDVGMHAAYRTGDGKPWTIEVFEAPTENTPGPDFKKLFEMDVASDRR